MSKYNYKVTLHYLCGNEFEPCLREFKVKEWNFLGVLGGADKEFIILTAYDYKHKIESVHKVPLNDVEVVVIENSGRTEKQAFRLHRKKTPQTAIVLDV